MTSPVQAMAWGLGLAAGLELPDRWGGLVDLPPVWDDQVAARWCGVLAGCGEDQVAVRGSGVFARRLVRAPLLPQARRTWSATGTVLVTGGTGSVAGHTSRWLARGGAARLVLASRSGPQGAGSAGSAGPARSAAGLAAELAGLGTAVSVVACDVGVRAQVAGLLGWVRSGEPRLTAVFHAAGVLDDGMLDGLDRTRLASVLAVKAAGAAHLDELTTEDDLDAFVLFSSAAATLGSAGQGNYAAANAYLDALAQARRDRGQPGLSVAWGAWGGGGLAQTELVRRRLRRSGQAAMDPERAVRALEQALAAGDATLTVLDADWTRIGGPGGWPSLLRDLPEAVAASGPAGASAGPELVRRLAALAPGEQVKLLTGVVRSEAAVVLGHTSADAVAAGRVFKDLGFDSLTAVELRNRLAALTGLRLPATLVFDYPTPTAVARFVQADLAGDAARTPAALAPAAASQAGDPVAIVGMGCRYPGGVTEPEDLWDMLLAGRDAISDLPADRGWDVAALYNPDPDHAGTSYTRRGSFLDGAADFDPAFFGISPREALAMDPQQRLLLEVCWEAIERAGIDPAELRGSATGVFAGASASGYDGGFDAGGESEGYLLTGNATSVLSGRVSYTLGLEGPAVSVDTACSSSLVALHLACQALRSGECDMALAGGVEVIVHLNAFTEFSRQRGLAADGRCKPFAASADGIGWSEGAGILLLERLSDARRNGHRVLAVVRGSAANQDGASNGLTAPNGPAQQRVIRAALASAGLTPDQVDAVEAHGTGTTLGDPIEAQALIATYGQDRPQDRPLWLGSVKSNIGHAQCASGAAGVIKMVLALQHGVLPRTLHAAEPSPHVDWSAGQVRLLTETVPWPAGERPRRAGVSGFGVSGTNVHAIVEEAPAEDSRPAGAQAGSPPGGQAGSPPVLTSGGLAWLVSGRTGPALRAQAARLAGFAADRPELDPADVGWSLAVSRSAFEHRAVITGTDRDTVLTGLAAVAAGEPAAGTVTGTVDAAGGPVVFVFPGQGGQWAGMGRELAASSPVFAARLAECSAALAPYVDWDLEQVLGGAPGAPGLDTVDVVQPALWAVMVSLAATWQAAGVTPDAVAGHSQGEIAAACVAGILSLDDAAQVVALRSRALMALAGHGGMLSVAEPADTVRDRLTRWGDRLAVAAVNGPAATVVSGEPGALAELAAQCAEAQVRTRRVPVDYASHGAQVEAIQAEILTALAGVVPGPAAIPMVSAMTGQWLDGLEAEAQYWYDSLRAPVRFDQAVRVLAQAGHRVFIEVSPHPVLTTAVAETIEALPDASAPAVAGTLRRDDGGPARFLTSLAEVHVRGVAVNWSRVLPAGTPIDLPTYAFQRQRYWPRPALASAAGAAGAAALGLRPVGHPLLGAAVQLAGGDGYLMTGQLSLQAQPWLADHAVQGTLLLPGTAFVELAGRAGDAAGCGQIEELTLEAPLVLPSDGRQSLRVQVTVSGPDESGGRSVHVYAQPEDESTDAPWRRHASGRLVPAARPGAELMQEFAVWPPPGAVPADTSGRYESMAAEGYGYGPAFRGLGAAWRRGTDVFAEVALPAGAAAGAAAFGLHPALLDAALHAAGLGDGFTGSGTDAEADGTTRMPFAWTGVSVYTAGVPALRVRLRPQAGGLSLAAADGTGMPVVSVDSLVFRPVTAALPESAGDPRDALFCVEWVPIPSAGPTAGDPRPQVLLAGVAAGAGAGAEAGAGAGVGAGDTAEAARAEVGRVLGMVQEWLSDDRLGAAEGQRTDGTRLAVVTRGAVAAMPGEGVSDLAGTAVWGLVRSAQSENPGRLVLIDLPPFPASHADADVDRELAVALATQEPEVAVRGGVTYGRRLARPAAASTGPDRGGPREGGTARREGGTVLITGGTGTLGGLVAGHLAGSGRARSLVLASRSGPGAGGVPALAASVADRGAGVRVVECDVADRQALAGVLAGIPATAPLTGVVHAAGVVDDGVIGSLTPARVDAVMRPKADAAWHLHELTADMELDSFVLFSSVAATFGGAGQGSYVAGNAFLDGLASYRQAAGLPGISLAWGLWLHRSGVGRDLDEGRLARISRGGLAELSAAEGLALLDLALDRDEALLVPARLDVSGRRAQARQGATIPALWQHLVRPAPGLPRPAAASDDNAAAMLRAKLAPLPVAERDRHLADLVRAHAAAVLGHSFAEAVEISRAFTDLGFDSLTAVELRNRLHTATGLRLPATLIFDYPTPVLLAARLRAELAGEPDQAPRPPAAASAAGEPVAIVAMGCRFPGGVRDPQGLWDLLAAGGDAISEFPADRGWDIDGLFNPDPGQAGTTYTQAGGFVAEAGDFDAGFFGISPREALSMDPQQRLLLEVSWEAIERAGIAPSSLRGSATGVYAGAAASGYGAGVEAAEGFELTGGATAVISGRVSYVLGLEGPAVTVDTACSSSLVALHLACGALRSGECDLALAGGVMVMADPGEFVGFSRQRGLAADGRCKSFGAGADGMGLGEGAGMVVLERLSDARRNGHRVLAVVSGSAVNQDGASNGLTAPNGPSQQRVIRAALAAAGVPADQVDAVEGHGSGTTLGDPIEAQALIATYGQGREPGRPLWLGSVKSNIGHAQTAAGVAGLIKMVLALQHQVLPATLHAAEPSSQVDWADGAVQLLAEPVPWVAGERPRRAGISSFGFSGTNVHVIVSDAPASDQDAAEPGGEHSDELSDELSDQRGDELGGGLRASRVSGAQAWLVSARTAAGLAAQAGRLAAHVAAHPELDPADVGWSLATGRSAFGHRAVVTGGDRGELTAGLAALAAGEAAPEVVSGTAGSGAGTTGSGDAGRVVFVFPGQGGQWAGMGRELAESSPVFAARLAECGRALAPYVDWDLTGVLADAAALDRVEVVQPALWAVMVSLAAAWEAAGVVPDAVAGHSQGEIAAATVAGILSLEDGARIVALRSKALRALAGHGAMVSVAQAAAVVRQKIAAWGERLSVAAVNGPAATVVSGEPGAVQELAAACAAEGVRARVLPVDYASHSPQVESLREEIAAALASVSPVAGRVPMVSAMTGEWLDGAQDLGAGYWFESLRAPVEFGRAVRVLGQAGHRVFVEVSPHPVLTGAITATLEDAVAGAAVAGGAAAEGAVAEGAVAGNAPVVTGTLRRDDGGAGRFLQSLAEAYVRGVGVDWAAVLGAGTSVELPTYAFQHQRYWPGPGAASGPGAAELGLWGIGHPLLGAAVELAGGTGGYLLTGRLSVRSAPWLTDHAVSGTVLLPGTAFVEMAIRAGDAAGCGRIRELALEIPLVLPSDGAVQLQVVVGEADASDGRPVRVYARAEDAGPGGPWTLHASGLLSPAEAPVLAGEFAVWPPAGAEPVEVAGWYEGLAAAGLEYGPSFRGLRAAWRRGADVFTEVVLPEAAENGTFGIHPALLDAALHAAGLTIDPDGAGSAGRPGEVRLPFAYTGVSLHAAGASALRVRLRAEGGVLSLVAVDATGAPVVSVDALVSRPVAAGTLAEAGGRPEALFTEEWVPVPAAGDAGALRWAVTGADDLGLAAALAAAGLDVRADVSLTEPDGPVPDVVLACAGASAGATGAAAAARVAAGRVLELVQRWLEDDRRSGATLVVVTRGVVAAGLGDVVTDLAGAAVWGLVRSAQSEHPGRLMLVDLPATPDAGALTVLAAALGAGEPELAIRGTTAYGRRLARPAGALVPPAGGVPWRLDAVTPGSLDGLELVACPQVAGPLSPGQVRVSVRAAGMNFRDVAVALGLIEDRATTRIGGDVAGVVTETGPGVSGLTAGDRVLGMAEGAFGPVAVTDARLLVPVPAGWSFAQAASVPAPFATAWYALVDLAGARPGQRLLVHAAAGGVGMAAVTIARHLGLEVYGTASPAKQHVLAAMGLDEAHISSSRTTAFEDHFLAATGGAGLDIVLNSLTGELADASLRLLTRGGAFVEMGKTDIRAAAQVAGRHPGVAYRAFDLGEAGPDRLEQILGQVTGLLAAGDLTPLPVRAWDVRRAAAAFRFMSQARHVGKIVLTIPPDPAAPRPPGTVLITGGTGVLGGLVAGHLAGTGRVSGSGSVLLASRSGPAAAGAAALAASVAGRGATVRVVACDAADRAALAGLLAQVPAAAPLTAVVHAAGILDDAVTGSLTPARVAAVMRSKADAAWHLHELTRDADLAAFVLFSSAAATFGSAGQGNYNAGNAFVDGLAAARQAAGQPGTSLAWGLWADASDMTGHLSQGDRARISRAVGALTAAEGLALLDAALARDEARLIPARLDLAALRAQANRGEEVPPLWRGLITPAPGATARPPAGTAGVAGAAAADALRQQLAGLPGPDRDRLLTDLVRSHAAVVLGYRSAEQVTASGTFKDLGFDSLTALELRNRLNAATGLRLPATLIFDHPTPAAVAGQLLTDMGQDEAPAPVPVIADLDQLESALSALAPDGDLRDGITKRLQTILSKWIEAQGEAEIDDSDIQFGSATPDEVFDFLDKEHGAY